MAGRIWYCGKRPAFEDNICSETMEGVAAEFNHWLDNSMSRLISAYDDEFTEAFDHLPTVCVCGVFGEQEPDSILAVVSPSRDKSVRRAWFTVFTDLSSEWMANYFTMLPDAYRGFLNVSHRLLQSDGQQFGLQERRDTLWTLGAALPRDISNSKGRLDAFLTETSVDRFTTAFECDSSENHSALRNLIHAALPLHSNVPANFRATFRFPLSARTDRRFFEISTWLMLTEMTLNGLPAAKTLFWTSRKLDLTFAPSANCSLHVPYLMGPSNPLLWDFTTMQLSEESIDERTGSVLKMLDTGDCSLVEIVHQLKRIDADG